jgi:soluble lytic murein transglycosylase-like protein
MESVPYWETRGYVATVLRNYWMYERQAGGPSESRTAGRGTLADLSRP